MQVIWMIALSVLAVSRISAGVTTQEAKLLNDEALRYFSFPSSKDALTTYAKGKPSEKTYHFTNLHWKTHVIRLTESDRRNGITRKVLARLHCDSSFRIQQNGKWNPWREGAWGITSTTFRGYLITEKSGKLSYKPSMASLVKYYSKSGGKGTITPIRKK